MFELERRSDIDLESFRRVAWEGEPVRLRDATRARLMGGPTKRPSIGADGMLY